MRGNIRKRGKQSWQIKFEVGTANGKRQTRYVTVKGTRQDAQKELTRLLSASDGGSLPNRTKVTVAAYIDVWFASAHEQSPKTLERYRQLAAKQIVPHLGAEQLQKLTAEQVQLWHGTLLNSGLARRTITHAHRLLALVLANAVKNATVARNVATVHKPPAPPDTEVAILTKEQVTAVRAALVGRSLYPIVELALATGMRRGELLGLQWGDVNLDASTVTVARSVEETRAGLRLKAPKTTKGTRTITVPGDTVAMLRAHKVKLLELRLVLGLGNIETSTPVFGTIEAELLSPNNLTRAWHRALNAAGLPKVTFHSLRHYHASVLISSGVDVLTVSRRLGHAKAAITLDVYSHVLPGSDAAAARAIEGVLK